MMLFFIFAGLLLGATAADTKLADAKQCAEGPKFWCSNLKSAKACQALSHCIQAVWAVQAYPQDDDLTCKVCEGLVIEARNRWMKGDAEKKIEDLVTQGCKKIPYPAISSECAMLATDYLPEIIQLLAAQTDPLTVCTAMRLCNNKRIDKIMLETPKTPALIEASPAETAEITFNECDVCQVKMGNLARDFKKVPDGTVMDRMFLVCGEFGTYSTSCSSLVATNFDRIRNWLEDRMKPVDMCQLTNRCMQPTSKSVGGSAFEKDDWCGLCTETLNEWRSILVLNSTEEDFKDLLLDLCSEVGLMIDQCKDVVDQYYVPVYDWLLHQFQPKIICQDIGICPGKDLDSVNIWPIVPAGVGAMLNEKESQTPLNPQIIDKGGLTKDGPLEEDATWFKDPSLPMIHISLQTTGLNIVPQIKPLSGSNPEKKPIIVDEMLPQLPLERMTGLMDAAGSESCAICQTVLHEVEDVLMDGQTEEEIEGIVENICDRLPDALRQECRGFVEKYGSIIITLLAQKFDPATVCPKLKLCPEGLDIKIVSLAGGEYPKTVAYDLADVNKNEVSRTTEPKQLAESVTCVVCEYAVGMLQQALNDNATQEEIREAMIALCDRLPDAVAGECELLVDAYSAEIIDAMILDLTPEQTCRYLMLCKPPKKTSSSQTIDSDDMNKFLDFGVMPVVEDKKSKNVKLDATPACILCEFVMSQVEDMLKDNKTDKDIEDALKKVCKVMPSSVRADCNNFIDQYFELILQTLEHLPPSEVCSSVALCSTRHAAKNKEVKQKKEFKCLICKDVMKLLKEVLLDERIDKKIAGDFEKLCAYLPKNLGKKYRSQCHDVMEHYGPYVVNMLASLEKPEELCSYIDLCAPIPGLVAIEPNAENCILGPKYYCAKKKRAQLCDKEQFCEEKIWSKKKEGKKAKLSAKFEKK